MRRSHFTAVPRNGEEPIAYEWSSSIDGVIGNGATFETALLSGGEHVITALAEDALSRDDDDTITITVVDTADLEVTDIDAPAVWPIPASRFDVDWTITNTGRAFANGPWVDRVYMSPDDVFGNGNDTLLGQFPFAYGDSVAPDEEYDNAGAVHVSGDAGDYWIIVVADTNDQLEEGVHEDNNVLVSMTSIELSQFPMPDLEVIGIAAPVDRNRRRSDHRRVPGSERWFLTRRMVTGRTRFTCPTTTCSTRATKCCV